LKRLVSSPIATPAAPDGFGFVEMQEGGDELVPKSNGQDFNGRGIDIHYAATARLDFILATQVEI
jgi:hypothetical protein